MTKPPHDRVRTELLLLFACISIVTNAIGQVHGRVMMIDGKTPVHGVEVWVEYHLTHSPYMAASFFKTDANGEYWLAVAKDAGAIKLHYRLHEARYVLGNNQGLQEAPINHFEALTVYVVMWNQTPSLGLVRDALQERSKQSVSPQYLSANPSRTTDQIGHDLAAMQEDGFDKEMLDLLENFFNKRPAHRLPANLVSVVESGQFKNLHSLREVPPDVLKACFAREIPADIGKERPSDVKASTLPSSQILWLATDDSYWLISWQDEDGSVYKTGYVMVAKTNGSAPMVVWEAGDGWSTTFEEFQHNVRSGHEFGDPMVRP